MGVSANEVLVISGVSAMQRFGNVARQAFGPLPSRWPIEGSWLDRADKRVSGPLLRLQLGLVLEVVLSVPGCFFGMPAILAVAPSIVAAATSNTNTVSRQSVITLGAGGLLLCLWGVVLSVPRHSERIALKLFSMRACVVGPAVGMYLVESNPGFGAAARSQAHLTLLSWFVSLAPTLVIKHQTRRRRPLVCEAAQLGEITSKSVALKRCAHSHALRTNDAGSSPARPSHRSSVAVSQVKHHPTPSSARLECCLPERRRRRCARICLLVASMRLSRLGAHLRAGLVRRPYLLARAPRT